MPQQNQPNQPGNQRQQQRNPQQSEQQRHKQAGQGRREREEPMREAPTMEEQSLERDDEDEFERGRD